MDFKNIYLPAAVVVIVGILLFGPINSSHALPPRQEQSEYAHLLAQAETTGSVRVIVGVGSDFQPEGDLIGLQAVENQQLQINRAQDAVLQKLAPYRTSSVTKFIYIPYLALEIDSAGLKALIADPIITSVEEDKTFTATLASSIPVVGANTAWAMGYSGSGRTVAIVDTGVQASHAFFGGRVVSEACYSTSSPSQGIYTLCPNGSTSQVGSGAASPTVANCQYGSTNLCRHGTHVAGIAAGSGSSFSGVAKTANIIAIQVFSRFNSASFCYPSAAPCIKSYISNQISALERVYALRNTYSIAAVNLSLGGGYYSKACDTDSPSYKFVIDNLRSVGIATIVASGNEFYTSGISAPACISTAISVGATNDFDTVASFSNSAPILDMLAPGVSIYSSVPVGGYTYLDGTSMAAPHIAGAWTVFKGANTTASVSDVLAVFKISGKTVTDWRNGLVKPRLKLDTALRHANDDFNSALQSSYYIQNTTLATTATDDPVFTCISGQRYKSVWYKYVPTSNGNLTVNTFGSNYDTVLAIWTGTRTNLVSRGCNDDTGGTVQSRVSIPVTRGVTYYIEAASYGTGGGILRLSAATHFVYLPLIRK